MAVCNVIILSFQNSTLTNITKTAVLNTRIAITKGLFSEQTMLWALYMDNLDTKIVLLDQAHLPQGCERSFKYSWSRTKQNYFSFK